MNEHLNKAQCALQAAADMEVSLGDNKLPSAYLDLLHIAEIQAQVAQAEALTRIAAQLEYGDKGFGG